jgi:hypothetical protein
VSALDVGLLTIISTDMIRSDFCCTEKCSSAQRIIINPSGDERDKISISDDVFVSRLNSDRFAEVR